MDTPIKIVQGNWFKIIQPLEKIEWNESEEQETQIYEPADGDDIDVYLISSTYNTYNRFSDRKTMEKIDFIEDSNTGKKNLLTYENNGTLPIGLYNIEIQITLNGNDKKKLCSRQEGIIQIVKTNKEASIPASTEFGVNTFVVEGGLFMCIPTKGDDGVGIASITTVERNGDGETNEVTITLTNNTHKTFYIKNGHKGADGAQGPQGPQGKQGPQGIQGPQGLAGKDGKDGKNGIDGNDGVGVSDVVLNSDNSFTFTFTDDSTIQTDPVHIEGEGGSGGQDGEDGEGIANISATDYSGSGVANVVTVTTTKNNIYSFNVYNGAQGQPGTNGHDGADGATPEIINDYWYINGSNTGVKAKGEDGHDGITPTITVNASVDNTTGTPSVTVTKTGDDVHPSFAFSFSGIKGEAGSSSGGEANVIEEIQLNGTKIDPVGKVVNINLSDYALSTTLQNYIQKAAQGTTGLLKPDGTVDNNSYLTQHQQVDWDAQSGHAGYISNKPTIDQTPTSGNTSHLVSSDGVYQYVYSICGAILTRLQGI